MEVKFIKANLNNSRPALYLLLQHAKEFEVGVLLISKPNAVPGGDNW